MRIGGSALLATPDTVTPRGIGEEDVVPVHRSLERSDALGAYVGADRSGQSELATDPFEDGSPFARGAMRAVVKGQGVRVSILPQSAALRITI